MAETLKFGAVEMRLGDDLKPRICELLCYCKLNKKREGYKTRVSGVTDNSRKSCDNFWRPSVKQQSGQVGDYSD